LVAEEKILASRSVLALCFGEVQHNVAREERAKHFRGYAGGAERKGKKEA
jgi:hypothetical protein